MFFLIPLIALALYLGLNPKAAAPELQWMLGIFMVAGYFAGFIDGRKSQTQDNQKGLEEIEKTEQEFDIAPSQSQYYFEADAK